MDRYGPAVLRLVVGATFMAHGAQKLFGIWGGGGLAGTAASFDGIGLSPGYPLAVAVALTESLGGLQGPYGMAPSQLGFTDDRDRRSTATSSYDITDIDWGWIPGEPDIVGELP